MQVDEEKRQLYKIRQWYMAWREQEHCLMHANNLQWQTGFLKIHCLINIEEIVNEKIMLVGG